MPHGTDDPIFGELLTDLTAEMWPLREKIANEERVKCALALARQKRIAAAEARVRRGFIDGLGEMVARIDADVYHRLAAIHGYETMRDPDFIVSLMRDSPEIRVKSVSRRTGIFVPEQWEGGEEPRMCAPEAHPSFGGDTDGHGYGESSADVCTQAAPIEEKEFSETLKAADAAEVAA
jgi:hypothetical protein